MKMYYWYENGVLLVLEFISAMKMYFWYENILLVRSMKIYYW